MKKNLFIFTIIILIVLQAVILSLFAYHREIDQDEGVYATAARMINKDFKPYIDFSINQGPIFLLSYSYWIALFGNSLFAARSLSVLSAVMLGMFLAYVVYSITKDRKITLIILFLYVFNGMLTLWQTPVKNYALSNLFLFVSFTLLVSIDYKKTEYSKILLAGIFLGLALNARLIFIPIIFPALIFILAYTKEKRTTLNRVLLFVFGMVLSSIYSIALFLQEPAAFYFNLFKRHKLEVYSGVVNIKGIALDNSSLVGGVLQKYKALYTLITDPQYLILALMAFFAMIILIKQFVYNKDNKEPMLKYRGFILAFGFIIFMSTSYLFTGFLHSQYFNQLIPYLLVVSVIPVGYFTKMKIKKAVDAVLIIFLLFYLSIGIPVVVFTHIPEISGRNGIWSIAQAEEVANALQDIIGKEDGVLTWWPMYAFIADRDVLRGMEYGIFAHNDLVMKKLTKEEAEEYHILTNEEVRAIIINHRAKVIIWNEKSPREFKSLIEEYYRVYKKIDGVSIYV